MNRHTLPDDLTPLLGTRPRRTLVAVGFLALVLFGIVVGEFLPHVLSDDDHRVLLWLVNGFLGVVLFVLFFTPVVGLLYGLWNGGPLVAFAVPTVPMAVGYAFGGQTVLVPDLALALCSAAAGAALATCRLWFRAAGSGTEMRVSDGIERTLGGALAFSVGTFVLALASLWTVTAVTVRVTAILWVAGGYLVVAFGGLSFLVALWAVPGRVPRLS